MSYENIQHPDTHQLGDSLAARLNTLQAEYKYLNGKYERVCDDLRSIIDRCAAGQTVYVIMPDGSQLFLQRADTNDAGRATAEARQNG